MTLDVRLAGFNVDKQGLEGLKNILEKEKFSKEDKENALTLLNNLTPETLSASYARISRDPRPIYNLREEALKDIKKARKSNEIIIFSMGHKSIAEHAFFNFDILGISRKAIEELESKRLMSYTEKSQRYITLDGDFILPSEISSTDIKDDFLRLIEKQNDFYKKNLEKITRWHLAQDYSKLFKALNQKNKEKQSTTVKGLGKEDTRYILSQATEAQLGLSTSARNLEILISRLRSSDIEEHKELGKQMSDEIEGIAPSVIKYTESVDYFTKTRKELSQYVSNLIEKYFPKRHTKNDFEKIEQVELYTKLNRDDSIIAGLIFSSSLLNYQNCLILTDKLPMQKKLDLLDIADKYQEHHDPMLREYELGDRVAEFIQSSSAFAQMKRHRMNTLIPQEYSIDLGITIPHPITDVGLSSEFVEIMIGSEKVYEKILQQGLSRTVAEYALTNAHRRRLLFDANNRQVHAFCMERENLAAQWDIRELAEKYHSLIQKESPLTLRKLCGKHEFYDVKGNL